MKKTVLLILLVMMFVLAIPVAAEHFQPVGERFKLSNWDDGWCEFDPVGPPSAGGVTTLDANTPFNINHGWGLWLVYNYPDGPPQDFAAIIAQAHKAYFELSLDGEILTPSGRWRFVEPEGPWQLWVDVYNFDDGMTGVHEFQGTWGYPYCAWYGIPIHECEDFNEFITVVCTVEVTFTE